MRQRERRNRISDPVAGAQSKILRLACAAVTVVVALSMIISMILRRYGRLLVVPSYTIRVPPFFIALHDWHVIARSHACSECTYTSLTHRPAMVKQPADGKIAKK